MKTPEVSEIFAKLPKEKLLELSPDKQKVVRAILNCRTAVLGAHVRECNQCKFKEQSYNSCRNRHCPKCQGSVAAKWVDARSGELLPVSYSHTVFTVPSELRSLAYQNKKIFYELLFKTVAETMHAVSKRFLKAEITFYSILHTWNQKLDFHPHIHTAAPQGGISSDGTRWVPSQKNFFLPVRALSKVFRAKMLQALKEAHPQFKFYGAQSSLSNCDQFDKLLKSCTKSNWVVYSKKPFGGPQQVTKYLSSYVHRIAISNHRILKVDDSTVTFRYRDSKNKNKKRPYKLSHSEFTRRFLLHILPKGFTRIRHYGFLSNCNKATNLALARELIAKTLPNLNIKPFHHSCPKCKSGKMSILKYFTHSSSKYSTFHQNFSPQTTQAALYCNKSM